MKDKCRYRTDDILKSLFKKNPNFVGFFYHLKYKHIGFSGQQRGGIVPYVIDPYVDSSKATAQECSPENERNLQQRHAESKVSREFRECLDQNQG